jgi:hypothetical protein
LACENSVTVLIAISVKSMKIFVLVQVVYRIVFSYYSTSSNEITNTLKNSVTDLHNGKIGSAGDFWFQA